MIIRTWVFFKRFDFKLLESFNYLWSAFIGLLVYRFWRHGDARLKTKMRGIQFKLWELTL